MGTKTVEKKIWEAVHDDTESLLSHVEDLINGSEKSPTRGDTSDVASAPHGVLTVHLDIVAKRYAELTGLAMALDRIIENVPPAAKSLKSMREARATIRGRMMKISDYIVCKGT